MTLGNANVWYHMQFISPHKFNMFFFYCLCVCVFVCLLVFVALPRCLTNKTPCQKGLTAQMQRPTGPAKNMQLAPLGGWECGPFSKVSGSNGFYTFSIVGICWGIRGFKVEDPLPKGIQ